MPNPNSDVILLKGVPLVQDGSHTILFQSRSAQESYFREFTHKSYNDQSYIGKLNGIEIDANAGEVFDCNYLMFNNRNTGANRWFYCFIEAVNYITQETTEILYRIDPVQSYLFEMEIEPCFVEREHTETDEIGNNLVPDNIEYGEYRGTAFESLGIMDGLVLIFCCGFTFFDGQIDNNTIAPSRQGNMVSCLSYYKFNATNIPDITNFLNLVSSEGVKDGIVSAFMIPGAFNTTDVTNISKTIFEAPNDFEGYVPQNNKLYTHPYRFLYITNNNGQTMEYRYEFSTDGPPYRFLVWGALNPDPDILLVPQNYVVAGENMDQHLFLGKLPQVPWATDSFRAWLAQNATSTGISVLAGVGSALTGLATGNPLATLGGVAAIVNSVKSVNNAKRQSQQVRNGESGNNTLYAGGYLDFNYSYTYITREYAEKIDRYWTAVGYPVKEFKIPNIRSRPNHNYVLTIDAHITGDINSEMRRQIEDLFNRGITFWHNPSTYLVYNANNKPNGG